MPTYHSLTVRATNARGAFSVKFTGRSTNDAADAGYFELGEITAPGVARNIAITRRSLPIPFVR